MQNSKTAIGVVGLGYVGLPLAVEFGRKRPVIGFDTNDVRIEELSKGIDRTLETTDKELSEAVYLSYTNNIED
jgi:UDP-N-acetyl-D-mannosaminuronate dehydrogenase